jgi:methylmalonyl-CoA mutase C-terminal domain/subunit
VLSGAHLGFAQQVLERLCDKGLEDIKVVLGGVIPVEDVARLKDIGVAAVFPGGTPFARIVTEIRALVAEQ